MLVDTIVDKKGSDILLLDLRDQAVFADYFLIFNGDNARQLKTLVESVATEAKQNADIPTAPTEGDPEGGWVLVDFGDLVVHAFGPETRRYYNLEELWRDAHVVLRMQ